MQIDINNIRRHLTEMGAALVPISIPIGMMVKLLTGNLLFGNLCMALGIFLLFPFRRLREGFRLGLLTGVAVFFIMAFVYYFCSEFSESVYLLYLGVTLCYALGLSLLHIDEDMRMDKFIRWLWLLSLLCILSAIYCFTTGKIDLLSGAFGYSEGGDLLYDGLTMGSTGITQLVCTFYILSTQKTLKTGHRVLLLLLIIIDFAIVLLAFKRTPLLIALFIIIYYLRRLGYLKATPRNMLILIACITALTAAVLATPDLRDAVAAIAEDTYEGVVNLVTGTHTGNSLTNSTDIRLEARQTALGYLSTYDMLERVIGGGFMTFWFDMPLLQAYLDMGIIGVLLYGFYTVYLPFKMICSKMRHNDMLCCLGMLSIYGAICCLTSGHPYSHTQWIPVCILCFALNNRSSLTPPSACTCTAEDALTHES